MEFFTTFSPWTLAIVAVVTVGAMFARKCDCVLLMWAPNCKK